MKSGHEPSKKQEFEEVLTNTPVAFHRMSTDGVIKHVNDTELELLGYNRDEYVGRHISDFHVDNEKADEIIERVKNGEKLQDFESRLRCKDGTIKHVLIDSGTFETNGKFNHTLCFTRDITDHRETEKDLNQKINNLKRLYVLNSSLLKKNSVEGILKKVMNASSELLEADKTCLQIYDPQNDVLRLVDHYGFGPDFTKQFQDISTDNRTICAAALQKKERVFVEDLMTSEEFSDFANQAMSYDIRSALSMPLLGSDRQFFGLFTMYWDKPHKPSEDKLQMLELYTRQATQQIELKWTENELHRQEKQLKADLADFRLLQNMSLQLIEEENIDTLYKKILDAATEIMNSNCASMQMVESDSSGEPVLRLLVHRGFTPDSVKYWETVSPYSDTPCSLAMNRSERVIIPDIKHCEFKINSKNLEKYRQNDIRAVQSTPLISRKGKLLGMISTHWSTPREPSEHDYRLLDILARQAADIIEQKQAKDELRKREKKYRTLFESIDEGFCIIQVEFDDQDNPVDYRFLEANPSLEAHSNLKNVEGKYISELIPDLERKWLEVNGEVALTGKSVRYVDYSENQQRWFNKFAFRIGEPEERKVAILFSDITEQKIAEEERENLLEKIRMEQERLVGVFRNAPTFMSIQRGPDHVFERVNDRFREMAGDRELIGKPVREAFPEYDGEGFFDILDQVYKSGEPYVGNDVRVILQPDPDKPPKIHFVDFIYHPLREPNGSISGVFLQGVDVTERVRAKRELQSMNESLEERVEERTAALKNYQNQLRSLASELSKAEERERHRLAAELHDNLGQMLAVAKMKMDLLPQNKIPSEISAEFDGVNELIENALTYTRELMSDLKPPPSIDDEDIIANIRWIAKKMEKHGLKVTIDDDGHSKPVSHEIQTTLLQCVRELLFNVLKHTSEDIARIELERNHKTIKITVSDNGPGFDTNFLDNSPAEDGGFGLFNVRERIDLMGGSVFISSSPGRGTTVSLIIPSRELNEHAAVNRNQVEMPFVSERSTVKKDKKIKVLLADDHQMVRAGLRKIIEEEDDMIVIGEAANGKEAVNLARELSPDVILMDVNMPQMDGIEATGKIYSEMSHIRIIGLSLHDDEDLINDMRNVGATAYLTKTEAFEALCATIRSEATILQE